MDGGGHGHSRPGSGFAPEATAEERDALFAAFASMTFERVRGAATSVVLTQRDGRRRGLVS